MIAYKWVIKENNKYFPLRKFGIDGNGNKNNNPPYKLNKIYTTICKIKSKRFKNTNNLNSFTPCRGFHFWKSTTNELLNRWNRFLTKLNQPIIKICLKCEIKKQAIFVENDYQLVAKEFKVLEEIKI